MNHTTVLLAASMIAICGLVRLCIFLARFKPLETPAWHILVVTISWTMVVSLSVSVVLLEIIGWAGPPPLPDPRLFLESLR